MLKNKEYITSKRKYIKKIVVIIVIIFLFIILTTAVCIIDEYILISRYNSLTIENGYTSSYKIKLSKKDKMADFNNCYNILMENIPAVAEYEKLYGISYSDRKEYYADLISNTTDEYEFYCTMCSILFDFPGHTTLFYPEYDRIAYYGCFNSENVVMNDKVKDAIYSWNSLLAEKITEYNNNTASFAYYDGKYIYYSATDFWNDKYFGCELIELNGLDIDSCVMKYPSVNSLGYDHNKAKPYREAFFFNDKCGNKVQITLRLADGTIVNENVYMDIGSDIAYIRRNIDEKKEKSKFDYFEFVDDNENNVAYISVNSFSGPYGNEIKEAIISAVKTGKPIVFDIRNNSGGSTEFIRKNIYPYLFSDDEIFDNKIFIKNEKNNKKLYNSFLNKIAYSFKKTDDKCFFYYNKPTIYNGENPTTPNIYILTSRNTFSAADGFASMCSDKDYVTIVGTHTGGEGLSGTSFMEFMPHSKLVYIYMPSTANNLDGTSNVIYGTDPDIYIESSAESYIVRQKIADCFAYENRLKWDNVLIDTLEIIKEKKNTK